MHIYYEGGQEMIVRCWFKNKPKKELFLHIVYSVLRILSTGLHSSQVSSKFKKPLGQQNNLAAQ